MEGDHARFWANLFSGFEFGLADQTSFEGVSGVEHRLAAAGISKDEKRIAIITSDPDPVKAQLICSDIQMNIRDKIIIPIKPVFFDTKLLIMSCAQKFAEFGFSPERVSDALTDFQKELDLRDKENIADQLFNSVKGGPFEDIGRSLYFSRHIQGISYLESTLHLLREIFLLDALQFCKEDSFDFAAFSKKQPYAAEIMAGVCALPLQEFSENVWERFLGTISESEVRSVLKRHGIIQYFEPPIDQMALGLIERGINSENELTQAIYEIPKAGHPLAKPELVSETVSVETLVENLRDKELVVHGEYELSLSSAGKTERMSVKFQPREGLFSRISKVLPYLEWMSKIIG